jgi:DNA-directed RNA polymerase specialized sigma24 family protein
MIRNINGNGPGVGRDVVSSAAAGVQDAWDQIVDTYAGLVWEVPRRYQLSRQDAVHVSQLTWMRLSDRIADIAPEALAGWLERTAERECTRVMRLCGAGQEQQAQPA